MSDPIQLTLAFEHRASLSGEDFLIAPCNREAVQWLDQWHDWPSPVLALYGPSGCGKTHLTRVFMAQANGTDITNDVQKDADPSQLLAPSGAYVIDDAEGLAAGESAENLLHFYNVAKEIGAKILITAEHPPARWVFSIPDLASRLKAATAVGIGAPDDALIGGLLAKLFADRQLKIDDDVLPYMLARMERSFDGARKLVGVIDDLALSKHRNITIPLVRQVFETC